MVQRVRQSAVALLLVIGVTMIASDASRLLCEYLCAEAVDHEHVSRETSDSRSSSEATFPSNNHARDISPEFSSTEIVFAASDHDGDCGPIDPITVANNQQGTAQDTQSLNTTAVVVFGCGASNNTALTDAAVFGSPPHSPPELALAARISLRI